MSVGGAFDAAVSMTNKLLGHFVKDPAERAMIEQALVCERLYYNNNPAVSVNNNSSVVPVNNQVRKHVPATPPQRKKRSFDEDDFVASDSEKPVVYDEAVYAKYMNGTLTPQESVFAVVDSGGMDRFFSPHAPVELKNNEYFMRQIWDVLNGVRNNLGKTNGRKNAPARDLFDNILSSGFLSYRISASRNKNKETCCMCDEKRQCQHKVTFVFHDTEMFSGYLGANCYNLVVALAEFSQCFFNYGDVPEKRTEITEKCLADVVNAQSGKRRKTESEEEEDDDVFEEEEEEY